MSVYYRKAKRVEQNSTRNMQAETFLNRDYNLASEAYLQCPNCTIKPQRLRTTRKHIESVHGENVTFECIQEVEGGKCGFVCGGHIGCFNKHQIRMHDQVFNGIHHKYDESTGFFLRHEGAVIAKSSHSKICKAERDTHAKVGNKRSRDTYRAKKKNASKDDVSLEEASLPSFKIVIRKRKVGGHEVVPTPAKKVKLNAERVETGKACKRNTSNSKSGASKLVTAEAWKWTRKLAAVDVVLRNAEKAKAKIQSKAQETGLNAALDGFKDKPYVDGVRVVYTHPETGVATPEPKNVKKGSVVDITEEDDDDVVVLRPLSEDTTPKVRKVIAKPKVNKVKPATKVKKVIPAPKAKKVNPAPKVSKVKPASNVSKVNPEEIQTHFSDEVINIYTYDAEQFAEIITLGGDGERKGESIRKKAERKIEETMNRLLKEQDVGPDYQLRRKLAFLEACVDVGMKNTRVAEKVIARTLGKLAKTREAKLSSS